MTDATKPVGVVNRTLPGINQDNTQVPFRATHRGEAFSQPIGRARHALADQGTYFTFHSPTIDVATTTVGHAAPVLLDADATLTKPLIHLMHGGAATSQVRCYLDFIEIEVIVAGANGTSDHWTSQLDTGTTRYSSGTVETLTLVNPNMQSTASPVLVAKAGPFVATAESASVRRLGHGTFKSTIELAGDKYIFTFGGDPVGQNKVSAAASVFPVNLPPVILGPTDQFLLALWQVAQDTAGVYKIRGGFWEV
jgi:hypothetical protein